MSKEKPRSVPYLWPVGMAGFVAPERVIVAGRWESAPVRRAVHKAKAEGRLIDLTYGRACKWVIFLDTGHLVLTSVPMPVAVLGDDFDETIQSVMQQHGEV
jgi:regulator of extracellular matrix RemA (YlzA/DUF370 family)